MQQSCETPQATTLLFSCRVDFITTVIALLDDRMHGARKFHPIEFWCTNAEIFQALAEVALGILGIPTTSAPIERVLSHGGIIIWPHRVRLQPETLENLILAKCNGQGCSLHYGQTLRIYPYNFFPQLWYASSVLIVFPGKNFSELNVNWFPSFVCFWTNLNNEIVEGPTYLSPKTVVLNQNRSAIDINRKVKVNLVVWAKW